MAIKKVTIKQLQKKFKDANKVESVQNSIFYMKDYDLNSIYYDAEHDSFYIKNNAGEEDKELYNCYDEQMAEIIN